MAGQVGRPEKYTVEYFPHFVADKKVVRSVERHFKSKGYDRSKGYAGYYKLLELIGDTKLHRPGFKSIHDKDWALEKTDFTEDEFVEMIYLLIDMEEVDRELWKKEKVIWMEDFVKLLKPVYYNRGKPLPTKDGIISTSNNSISTSRNQQEGSKGSKGTKGREETATHTPQIDLKKYSEEYPTLDVELSFERYKLHCDEKHKPLSDKGFNLWVRGDMNSGWNQKTASEVDKSNEFVTMYCPDGHMKKQADINKTWDCFCDECEEQMVFENELKPIRGVSK